VALSGEVIEKLRANFVSSHDSLPVSQRRGKGAVASARCERFLPVWEAREKGEYFLAINRRVEKREIFGILGGREE
jgi:hypothetical protein